MRKSRLNRLKQNKLIVILAVIEKEVEGWEVEVFGLLKQTGMVFTKVIADAIIK